MRFKMWLDFWWLRNNGRDAEVMDDEDRWWDKEDCDIVAEVIEESLTRVDLKLAKKNNNQHEGKQAGVPEKIFFDNGSKWMAQKLKW
jgi:hypothetical protein